VHPAGKIEGVLVREVQTEVIDCRYAVFDHLTAKNDMGDEGLIEALTDVLHRSWATNIELGPR